MTIRDPEVLELLRDEPELLALADAVAETQARPAHARRRPRVFRAGGVLAVAAAVLLAVLLWPGGGGRPHGVLDRALAAIGDGRVLHLVVRVPTGTELVQLHGDRAVTPVYDLESWGDRSSRRVHLIIRLHGRAVAEMLLPEDATSSGGTVGPVDPAYAALWTGYREALANGTARVDGEGSVYGHRVYWLRFASPERGRAGSRVAIDRRTYRPVAFAVSVGGGRVLEQRVLLARTEPFAKADFERKTSLPSPLEGSSSGSTSSSGGPIPGRRHLAKPWLTAGETVAGLKLTSVNPTTVTSEKRTTHGVELVYGSDFGARWIRVDEERVPGDQSEARGIPDGYVSISGTGETTDDRGNTRRIWTGELVSNGLYVTIETDLGRSVLLAAARALRPA